MSWLKKRAAAFDGVVVRSQCYRNFMLGYLDLNPECLIELPLAIDCQKHDGQPKPALAQTPTVGYFARICPEKGLDILVESVVKLKADIPSIRLRAGGYLNPHNQDYFERVRQIAKPLGDDFEYIGSPATHAEKVAFLKSVDVFSVPARFQEPKGIYVLEAWANGLPVVLPRHAAFPELIESTGGGVLSEAENVDSLTANLRQILQDATMRRQLAKAGHAGVRHRHDLPALAGATVERLLKPRLASII